MNILCQIVHGSKEIPNLGLPARILETPDLSDMERATFGVG